MLCTYNQNQCHTREAYNNKVTIPHVKTTCYGLQSKDYDDWDAKDWDEIQKELKTLTSVTNITTHSCIYKLHKFENGTKLSDKK